VRNTNSCFDPESSTDVILSSFGDPTEPVRKILDDELKGKCKRIWGLDEELEICGLWRDLGIPHLWSMMGESFLLNQLR
jgi:hypothetical protein